MSDHSQAAMTIEDELRRQQLRDALVEVVPVSKRRRCRRIYSLIPDIVTLEAKLAKHNPFHPLLSTSLSVVEAIGSGVR